MSKHELTAFRKNFRPLRAVLSVEPGPDPGHLRADLGPSKDVQQVGHGHVERQPAPQARRPRVAQHKALGAQAQRAAQDRLERKLRTARMVGAKISQI